MTKIYENRPQNAINRIELAISMVSPLRQGASAYRGRSFRFPKYTNLGTASFDLQTRVVGLENGWKWVIFNGFSSVFIWFWPVFDRRSPIGNGLRGPLKALRRDDGHGQPEDRSGQQGEEDREAAQPHLDTSATMGNLPTTPILKANTI